MILQTQKPKIEIYINFEIEKKYERDFKKLFQKTLCKFKENFEHLNVCQGR